MSHAGGLTGPPVPEVYTDTTDPEILAYQQHQRTAARPSPAEEAKKLVHLARQDLRACAPPAALRQHPTPPCRPPPAAPLPSPPTVPLLWQLPAKCTLPRHMFSEGPLRRVRLHGGQRMMPSTSLAPAPLNRPGSASCLQSAFARRRAVCRSAPSWSLLWTLRPASPSLRSVGSRTPHTQMLADLAWMSLAP